MPKTITITDEAHKRLTASKKPGETLSDAILRLLPPKSKGRDIMDLAGTWQGEEDEYKRILAHIAEGRNEPKSTPHDVTLNNTPLK